MKNLFTLLATVLFTATMIAQSPEKMNYQAVIRNSSDVLVTDTQIGMQISILQGSADGSPVYVETQTPTTNANGLVSIEIGAGTVVSGDFSTIDWANGPYYIKTETDPAGSTSYTITGTSQLLSVPYALHAKSAETVTNVTVDYGDVTNTPDLSNFDQDASDDFDGDYNSLYSTPDLSNYLTSEIDGSVTNEIQDLQLVGNILTITNNGTATEIDLSAYLDDTDTQLTDAEITALGYIKDADDSDPDATNEIQDLQLVGNILTITNNGTATEIDLSAYLDDTDTQLTDAEIAALGFIKSADDSDPDATNEIQDLQLVGNILTITNNGTATEIDLSAYLDDTDTQLTDAEIAALGFIKSADDADADATNEIELPTTGNTGDMAYWNGTSWVTVKSGSSGQVLTFVDGVPKWGAAVLPGVNEVQNPTTGAIWMDRNLGASQVATSSTDAAAYGDLYQWGRAADGHESRTSGTTATLATSDTPGHGDFILAPDSPSDWRSPQNDNLWQGVSGTNNPCPSGYRLPTDAEWEAERANWSSNNAAGAFASPLKLPIAGGRGGSNGSLYLVGSDGTYWSSTVDGTTSRRLLFFSSSASMGSNGRALGFSVRCLKD